MNKKKLFPVVAVLENATPSQKRKLGDVYFKRVLEDSDLDSVLEVLDDLEGKKLATQQYVIAKNTAFSILKENLPDHGSEHLIDSLETILEE